MRQPRAFRTTVRNPSIQNSPQRSHHRS
jgi:hypothetical protein